MLKLQQYCSYEADSVLKSQTETKFTTAESNILENEPFQLIIIDNDESHMDWWEMFNLILALLVKLLKPSMKTI